ncbi:DNA replication and repair protein RecF [Candidatus Saccharibacteria bacterium]|nr:DNA replication and repair protein RecF [Candidatus Saccharibacteria bacterium]
MIENIRLQNFRSYHDGSFEFDKGVNIVVGPNGSGKTNLLEAVLVLATGSSFRAKDAELIGFGGSWARLDGWFGHSQRTLKIILQGTSLQKSFVIDEKPYRRLSLERSLPVVLFEPNDLQLLGHGPQRRRDYFDDILQRTQAGYKSLNVKYYRALVQRNALLKQPAAAAAQQMFAWNIRLSELGAQIAKTRRQLIGDINKTIGETYSKIAHQKTAVNLVYKSPFSDANYSSKLLLKLEASATLDLQRGFTSYGPHREDVIIYLSDQVASSMASRGETRSLLLALKIFELQLLQKVHEQKPIFLLDDVFSELDAARRQHLVKHLKGYQSIITTTDADAVLEYFAGKHNLIPLQK